METPEQMPSSSFETTASLSYDTKGDTRLVSVLYRKVEEMEKKLHDLETKKIIDETQMPVNLLEENGLLPKKPERFKRGRGYRPILQNEIEDALKISPFTSQQAKWLGVHQKTYRKYAQMYGLYRPRPNEKGKRNVHDPERGKYPLSKIISGELAGNPSVQAWALKDKLIRGGVFPPKCNICGYDKRRSFDNKIALLVDFKDGNRLNCKLDNLQLLCLNCTFESGRGYIRRGNHVFDPDWLQDCRKDELRPTARW